MAGVTVKQKNDVSAINDNDVVTLINRGKRTFHTQEGSVEAGKSYEVSGKTAKALAAYVGDIELVHVVKGKAGNSQATETSIKSTAERQAELDAREAEIEKREKALAEKEAKKPEAPKEKAK